MRSARMPPSAASAATVAWPVAGWSRIASIGPLSSAHGKKSVTPSRCASLAQDPDDGPGLAWRLEGRPRSGQRGSVLARDDVARNVAVEDKRVGAGIEHPDFPVRTGVAREPKGLIARRQGQRADVPIGIDERERPGEAHDEVAGRGDQRLAYQWEGAAETEIGSASWRARG